jgi:hypothetical protein
MVHNFPDDLVHAQRDWYRAYKELAESPHPQTALLRRRLLRLSAQIAGHPFWDNAPGGPAARMALKQAAWSSAGLFSKQQDDQ